MRFIVGFIFAITIMVQFPVFATTVIDSAQEILRLAHILLATSR